MTTAVKYGPGNPALVPLEKTCITCRVSRNLIAYWRDKRRPDGRLSECRECMKKRNTQWLRDNRTRAREINARAVDTMRGRFPIRQMLTSARHRAKTCGWEFDLTEADITVPALCPVFGIPIAFAHGIGAQRMIRDHSPSLDRIDNTKGYVRGNVVVVSGRANRLKSDSTADELRALARFYCGGAADVRD